MPAADGMRAAVAVPTQLFVEKCLCISTTPQFSGAPNLPYKPKSTKIHMVQIYNSAYLILYICTYRPSIYTTRCCQNYMLYECNTK